MSALQPQTKNSFDLSKLENIIEKTLDKARQKGATAAEAGVSAGSGLSVNVRLGEVETIEHQRERGLGITVYFGQCKGSSSTSDFNDQAIDDAVTAACDIARYTSEDEYSGLASPELMPKQIKDLDLSHHWDIEPDAAIEIAKTCEAAALAYDKKINNSEGASLSTYQNFSALGNSHGFIGSYPTTRHSLGCSVLAQSGEDMQRDYWYTVARNANALQDAEIVGKISAERTIKRLNARTLSPRQTPVLFVPELARGLFGSFISAIKGHSLYREASFLLNKLDQPIFPAFIDIEEQPHLKCALASAPYDADGVETWTQDIVVGGILKSYILDQYAAKKMGLNTTGNAGGIHNLIVKHADLGLDDLIKQMDTGLLVTETMGHGVNIVTGDYSRGAAGFWVEKGEIQYPVHEITIAGQLAEMFKNIVAVGCDVDKRGAIQTGSVLIEQMTLAGEHDDTQATE